VPDRNKPNCFELYATGGNDFIKGAHLHIIYLSIIMQPTTTTGLASRVACENGID
jgi:hypothetical protein